MFGSPNHPFSPGLTIETSETIIPERVLSPIEWNVFETTNEEKKCLRRLRSMLVKLENDFGAHAKNFSATKKIEEQIDTIITNAIDRSKHLITPSNTGTSDNSGSD